ALAKTRRAEAELIPHGVEWYQQAVSSLQPEQNQLTLDNGDIMEYDYLVVCPGVVLNMEAIAGADALGRRQVCSNYSPEHVEYTWDCLQQIRAGDTLLFTQPPLPFKCPGAPQKIAYLAADYLQKKGLLFSCKLHFLTHAPAMFSVPLFAKELVGVAKRYDIEVHFQHELVSIDSANKQAGFKLASEEGEEEKAILHLDYSMLHFVPPQSPPAFIKSSPLANAGGYVDVDQHNMQHTRYPNVFGLGDACSTPNSKTAAAIRKQAPVVVNNLLTLIKGGELQPGYDGYASCPLTTAFGKVIMAEFIYGGKVTPTFPLDPRKERWVNWWIKIMGLPCFYWHYMLKGRKWFFRHNTDYVEPA
ncbi:MAG: NAD(P)/FAD-dependent oxidoreductase, partial [Gammaproteobacteria bacterium]